MMKKPWLVGIVLAVILLLFVPQGSALQKVVSLEYLVNESEAIIIGNVTKTEGILIEGPYGGSSKTKVTIQVEKYLKGNLGSIVELFYIGSEEVEIFNPNTNSSLIQEPREDQATYEKGEKVLTFLDLQDDGTYKTATGVQGKYTITPKNEIEIEELEKDIKQLMEGDILFDAIVARLSFKELVTESTIISLGTVSNISYEKYETENSNGVFTVIRINTIELIHGPHDAKNDIALKQLGGKIDEEYRVELVGAPKFSMNETTFLFISPNIGGKSLGITGGHQGKYPVRIDSDGKYIIHGLKVKTNGEIERNVNGTITLKDLKNKIHQIRSIETTSPKEQLQDVSGWYIPVIVALIIDLLHNY